MSDRKFVFIGLDSVENRYLYSEFDEYSYSAAVFLPDFIRKVSKAYRFAGLRQNAISKGLLSTYFDKYIKRRLAKTGWIKDDDIVFIIYARDYESYGDSLVDYIRREYAHAFLICYFVDMIWRHKVEIDHVRQVFDDVFTYDEWEAEKYDLKYCMAPFSSKMTRHLSRNLPMKWDVTLVASAKERYSVLLRLYEAFRSRGFICDFHITMVPKKDRLYEDEIHYRPLEFETLLTHVIQSRCVVEYVQEGAYSPTPRFSESIIFDRNLLTNALFFKDKENEYENVFYYDDIENIPFEKICRLKNVKKERYLRMLSCKNMMNQIEEQLD